MKRSGYSQRDLIKFNFASLELDTTEFFGNSPPSVFVGRFGYPKVNVGVLSPVKKQENSYLLDNPKEWIKKDLKDEDILKLRAQLINSRFKSSVKKFDSKLLNLSQEVGMAYKPVDMEVFLKDKPKNMLRMSNILSPLSNNANVRNIKLTENPKVKNVVEKTVYDTDLKSSEGLYKLYKKNIDENFLSKLLSIGLLGLKKNRKLVPTRWSITASDSTLGNEMLKEIRYYDYIDYQAYFSGYLGNYYLILFFPDIWGYELFEMEVPFKTDVWSKSRKFYATDYEDIFGRKNYVEETAGGYYASRLPIIDKLKELKKQGAVIVLRFVTKEDKFPLGVWVCRESVKMSLNNKINIEFNSKESLLNYAMAKIKREFGEDISIIFKKSKILNRKSKQVRLNSFT